MVYLSLKLPRCQINTQREATRRGPGRHLLAALALGATVALAGCVSTNSTDPGFGQQDQAQSNSSKLAAFSPAAIGRSVSGTFKAGTDKVSKAFKPQPPKPEEMPTTEETVGWWPFNKKDDGPGADFFVSLARVHEQTGDLARASGEYEKALAIDHDNSAGLVGCAHLLDRQGEKVKAVQYYSRAAKLYPEDASVANDLGLCYARQGKFDLALEYLGKAVTLQPDRQLYRNNIATVLVEMGRVNEAVAQVAAVYGEPIAHYNVGVLLKQTGKRNAAIQQFALAVEKDPGLNEAREWLDRMNAEEPPREQLAEVQTIDSSASNGRGIPTAHSQPVTSEAVAISPKPASPARVASRPIAKETPRYDAPATSDATKTEVVAAPVAPPVPATPATPIAPVPNASVGVPAVDVGAVPATQLNYVPPSRY
ncbi:MAG TPA: tetratricopeptide repeat protein [Pirellulales bacterium]|jgi:tetratricopeptide (TPR) repeat protein